MAAEPGVRGFLFVYWFGFLSPFSTWEVVDIVLRHCEAGEVWHAPGRLQSEGDGTSRSWGFLTA